MLEAVMHAIGDRAIVVERGEDFLDLVQHVVDAGDVEERFLLAGERGVRQIFGGGGRAHGDGDVVGAGVLAELRVGLADRLVEIGRQRRIDDPAADFLAGGGQRVDVLDIERREPIAGCAWRARCSRDGPGTHPRSSRSRPAPTRRAWRGCRSSRRARRSCRRPCRDRTCATRRAKAPDRSKESPEICGSVRAGPARTRDFRGLCGARQGCAQESPIRSGRCRPGGFP